MRQIQDDVPRALADEPDAVHRLRTSVRRLRNVLAAFRRYLDRDAAAALRSQLKEWGDVLGHARDLEVRAQQAAAAADAAGLDDKPRSALVDPLWAAHLHAHDEAVRWTRSEHSRDLDRLLTEWATLPRLGARAGQPAKKAARRTAHCQAVRTLRTAPRLADPDAAHELRKAARRLRHTCDAITREPVELLGKGTKDLGSVGHRIQSVLGDHRDALLLAGHVRDHSRAYAHDSRVYDGVVDLCQGLALAALADLPAALADLERRARD